MKSFLLLNFLALIAVLTPSVARAEADTRCFELRVYHANPGKLEDLHARFRDHTIKLFEKHGITNLGYWTPLENPENLLIYVLAYPSREAREAAWKAFQADPDWKAARDASEKAGKLVGKVESSFLDATDFCPPIKPTQAAPRVFELRTYTTTPGNLDRLLKRFRDREVALFQKHGMTTLYFWTLQPGQPGSGETLVYMLAHASKEAGAKSFADFRADPEWVALKEASEKEGGGSLTAPNGVKSVYMQATDYSPTK